MLSSTSPTKARRLALVKAEKNPKRATEKAEKKVKSLKTQPMKGLKPTEEWRSRPTVC